MHEAVCLWCNELVEEDGDTCNMTCYSNIVFTLRQVGVINGDDVPPKDMHLQPWYAALANTQEG